MTIDMHSHWLADQLVAALRQRASKPMIRTKDGVEIMEAAISGPLLLESIETRIAEMDRTGVDHSVLSLTAVWGVDGLPPEEALPLCRINNDSLSDACRKYPGRLSALATLPVGDIEASIAEFERAMALPGMVGCMLPGDGFLSLKRAERFKPLLDVIDRHQALALVHYGKLPNDPNPIKVDLSDNGHSRMGTLDMQARISQNMVTLCLTDFMKAYPNLTMLSHNLGGNIPFEIERMDHRVLMDLPPGTELPSKRFKAAPVLVDCNSLGARSIEMAADVYGADKIVFGSDGTGFGMEWTHKAINDARLSETEREAIRHTNAARAIAKVKRPTRAAAE